MSAPFASANDDGRDGEATAVAASGGDAEGRSSGAGAGAAGAGAASKGQNQPTVACSGRNRSRARRRTSSRLTRSSRAGISAQHSAPPETSKNASWCARPARSSRSAVHPARTCRRAALSSASVHSRLAPSSTARKTAFSAAASPWASDTDATSV